MPKPFDATSKHLIEAHPASWLALVGLDPDQPVRVIDAELSTVSAEADKVLRLELPTPWILHLELQAGRDASLARRMLRYQVLLDARHDVPVHSVAILLSPAADGPELTGLHERRPPHGRGSIRFEYEVLRIWEQSPDVILAGGLGIAPLAPLAVSKSASLSDIFQRVGERIHAGAEPGEAATLWAATEILSGLRHDRELVRYLIRRTSAMILGIRGIEESSTYKAIKEEGEAKGRVEGRVEGKAEGKTEGRVEEARRILLRLGRLRFGTADAAAVAWIEALTDLDRIESLTDRLLSAASWQELLKPLREADAHEIP